MRQSRGEMHKPTRNKFHRLVAAGYFQPAFKRLYEHWHCGGMLAQLLAFIEGEKHYVRAFDAHHRAADGGLLLDLHIGSNWSMKLIVLLGVSCCAMPAPLFRRFRYCLLYRLGVRDGLCSREYW